MPRAQSINFLRGLSDTNSSEGRLDVSPLQFCSVQSAGTAEYCMQREPTPSFGGVIYLKIVARFYALPQKLRASAQGLQMLYDTYYLRCVRRMGT